MLLWLTFQLLAIAEPVSEERAKELFFNGQLLFDEAQYESAVLAWQKGYEITELPAFLKNIALAYEANQQYAEALDTLKQYRAFAPFEEQDELKQWSDELTVKLTEQEDAQKQADEAAELTRLAEEKKTEERKLAEAQTSMNVTNPTDSEGTSNTYPLVGLISTSVLFTTASAMTWRTAMIEQSIWDACKAYGDSTLCSGTVLQPDNLLTQFEQSQNISLALWGATIVSAGVTTWQWTRPNSNTQASLDISPTSIRIRGHF